MSHPPDVILDPSEVGDSNLMHHRTTDAPQ